MSLADEQYNKEDEFNAILDILVEVIVCNWYFLLSQALLRNFFYKS
jgi:hypothetical protein